MTWSKVTALAVVFIALIAGYSFLDAQLNAKCSGYVVQLGTDELVSIIDVRWTLTGCEYLLNWTGTGGVTWYRYDDVATLINASKVEPSS